MNTQGATTKALSELERITRPAETGYTREQLDLLKRTIAPTLDDNEFAFFVEVCKRTSSDPFQKEIYVQKRVARGRNGAPDTSKLVFVTGIDKYRSRAASTGENDGQLGPFWCGEDGQWRDVWLDKKPPSAAKLGVLRRHHREPYWGVARYTSYVQTQPDWQNGQIVGHRPTETWTKMPDVMLAKCAEALALRKAFPNELGFLRTTDEMQQADTSTPAALPEGGPPAEKWDEQVSTLSARIKKASKGGEMNAIAADLERLRKDGLPEIFYGALRHLYELRASKAKPKGEKPPQQDYEPTPEELEELRASSEAT
jgi:phage recombination protein Bet